MKNLSDKSMVELISDLNQHHVPNKKNQPNVQQTSNITPISGAGNKVCDNESRWDKACEIAWLMSPVGKKEALKLALENLVYTYDFKSVRDAFDSLNLNQRSRK